MFLINSAVGQEKDSLIYWSEDQPITWEDFEGVKTDLTETAVARSRLQIQVLTSLNRDNSFKCHYFAVFDRKKSFSIVTNPKVLYHEQIHFDIQEIFVRKMRKHFEGLAREHQRKTSICKDVFYKYYQSLDSLQVLYDAKTKHSVEEEIQSDWNRQIKAELVDTKEFSAENLYNTE